MAPLKFLRTLHRIVIFAIENHFSLAKWPPLLSVASSASGTDDILESLSEACTIFALDHASGFWQVQIDKASQEKTAFVTHHGSYS